MTGYEKSISERELLASLANEKVQFPPLSISTIERQPLFCGRKLGALLEVSWGSEKSRFAAAVSAAYTPKAFETITDRLNAIDLPNNTLRMVLLPYLSGSQLDRLERQGISGIDLCGNGVVIVPGRLFVRRTGEPNRFTMSAPIKNIYRKKTSMVPRAFLARPSFDTVADVLAEVEARMPPTMLGVSLSTVSKALKALDEDLIVSRDGGRIRLVQPDKLLAKLLESFVPDRLPVSLRVRVSSPLSELPERLADLSERLDLPVIATGLGSVGRYAVMQRGEVLSVYCPQPEALLAHLPVAESGRFANLEVVQTDAEQLYFDSRRDDRSAFRWAAPAQVYLELMRGDKRDQETAAQVRATILREAGGPA